METASAATSDTASGTATKGGRPLPLWPAWLLAAAATVAAVAIASLFPLIGTDTLCRYAPMAEAFAAGEWNEAFHPRFCVGMPTVAGLARLATGLDGLSACAAAAALAWGLGVIPVFRIAEAVFGRKVAYFAAILYIICPQPMVWTLKGLREPFKILGTLLMADGLLRCRDNSWSSAVSAAIGIALLFLFKCDSVLLGGILAIAYAVLDRFRMRTLALFLAGLAAIQPMCMLVYDWTGYWLPAPHYVKYWNLVFGG